MKSSFELMQQLFVNVGVTELTEGLQVPATTYETQWIGR